MRRIPFAVVLALACASSARAASPLDVDLARLGPPDAGVWTTLVPGLSSGDAAALAVTSRKRFAILSTDLGLALSSPLLQPASTSGLSGVDVDLETAVARYESGVFGSVPTGLPAGASLSDRIWPGALRPSQLLLPSLHVRKGLPFSFEIGTRLMYLAQSSYFALQGEAKWALNEGFSGFPDVAVRGAYTSLFGHDAWSLGATDLDLMMSKRFRLFGITAMTPYLAGRVTWVSASSKPVDFAPSLGVASAGPASQARFPRFSAAFYRTTLGARLAHDSFSATVEGTFFAGGTIADGFGTITMPASLTGAATVGWSY